ncbi:hypothetical protein TNCV_1391881 [Trichonephila clavipes]|nr:hypothetical protein TNCV_1391881 [Trichonephila clavipes]
MVLKCEALFQVSWGHGSQVVKVLDCGWPRHEFEPSTAKDPPCSGAMHIKSVDSSNVLLLVLCGSEEGRGASSGVDHGSKLCGPSPKSPRVAEQCDVNIRSRCHGCHLNKV